MLTKDGNFIKEYFPHNCKQTMHFCFLIILIMSLCKILSIHEFKRRFLSVSLAFLIGIVRLTLSSPAQNQLWRWAYIPEMQILEHVPNFIRPLKYRDLAFQLDHTHPHMLMWIAFYLIILLMIFGWPVSAKYTRDTVFTLIKKFTFYRI